MRVLYTKSGKLGRSYYIEVGVGSAEDRAMFKYIISQNCHTLPVYSTGDMIRYIWLSERVRNQISGIADRYLVGDEN